MIGILLAWQVAAAMPHLQQGRFADARPLLEKACAAKEPNGCYLLGRTLFTLDLYEPARTVLGPLAASDPDPWRVYDAIGSAEEAMRKPVEAERAFRRAVELYRDRGAEARYHLGRFLMREGRAADAVAVLVPAVKRFVKYELARFELGRAYYQMGRHAEAETELAAAPSLEEARRLLGKIRRQRGK